MAEPRRMSLEEMHPDADTSNVRKVDAYEPRSDIPGAGLTGLPGVVSPLGVDRSLTGMGSENIKDEPPNLGFFGSIMQNNPISAAGRDLYKYFTEGPPVVRGETPGYDTSSIIDPLSGAIMQGMRGDVSGGVGTVAGAYGTPAAIGGAIGKVSSLSPETSATISDAWRGGRQAVSELPPVSDLGYFGRKTTGGLLGSAAAHYLDMPWQLGAAVGNMVGNRVAQAPTFIRGAIESVKEGRNLRSSEYSSSPFNRANSAFEKPTPSRPSPPSKPLPKESPKVYDPFTTREAKTDFSASSEHPAEYNTSPFADFAPGRVVKGERTTPAWKEHPYPESTPPPKVEPIPSLTTPSGRMPGGIPLADPTLLQQLLQAGREMVRRRYQP